jgi:hypothetical protein
MANAVYTICQSDLSKHCEYLPFQQGGDSDPFLDLKIEVRILNDQVNGLDTTFRLDPG